MDGHECIDEILLRLLRKNRKYILKLDDEEKLFYFIKRKMVEI